MIAKHICDNHGYKRKGKAEEKKHKPQGYGGKGHGGNPRKFAPLCHINDKANQRVPAGCHFPFRQFLTTTRAPFVGGLGKRIARRLAGWRAISRDVPGSELGRQVAVDFESDADFHECGSCPVHSGFPSFHVQQLKSRDGKSGLPAPTGGTGPGVTGGNAHDHCRFPPLPKAMSKGECPLRLRPNSGAAQHNKRF